MVPCRVKRDEASIMAWENLQKAKAEAEIRKLEVLLHEFPLSLQYEKQEPTQS